MKEKKTEELIERKTALASEMEADDADLDAIEKEVREINEELERRHAAEKQEKEERAAQQRREELRKLVAGGAGETVKTFESEGEKKSMNTLEEIRSSKAYVNAFAEYIKSGDDAECRTLLTELVSGGTVPVPTIVEDRIKTAWSRLGIMDMVKKTYVKGILKVGFELSATGAVVHTEGSAAPAEQTLTFGVVTLTPANIKKWIKISDEAMDLKGEEFLYYIYDEITYRIAKAAQEELLAKITTLTTTAATNAVSVGAVVGSPSVGIVATALGELSDEAENPVVVINKGTWSQFKEAQYAANYPVDPFEGVKVFFDNTLAVFTTTTTKAWMIVGDFGLGAQANFPNGEEVKLTFDETSLAEQDLVKIVGREYVGLGIVADKAFAVVKRA